jgi:hypothetical protein
MEVDGIAIRPVVAAMAREMELQLRKHDADRGESWKAMGVQQCLLYIRQRMLRLAAVIGLGDYDETRRLAASVAVAALFAADNFGDLRCERE